MVRTGGLQYSCSPNGVSGKRINDLRTNNGEPVEERKDYKVAGWATVGSRSTGAPVWQTIADDLRDRQVVRLNSIDKPRLKGITDNAGLADY